MIKEEMLEALRREVEGRMSPKRFRHTVAVEKMAAYLGGLYAPERICVLRAAALLHDITKERTFNYHLKICAEHDIELDADAAFAPKTLHAKTAAALIPNEFPQFADSEVVDCVRWHTTGRADMSLLEKLIYLADYIDESRTFEDCVRLREYFMNADPASMDDEERAAHLRRTLILSYDMTVRGLIEEGLPINGDTVAARNQLIREEKTSKNK